MILSKIYLHNTLRTVRFDFHNILHTYVTANITTSTFFAIYVNNLILHKHHLHPSKMLRTFVQKTGLTFLTFD